MSDQPQTIYDASSQGNMDLLRRFLSRGTDANVPGKHGLTALHCAAHNGQLEAVAELLKRGARVDTVNTTGNTPLHLAASQGHVAVLKLLLDKTPRVIDIVNGDHRTALHHAALNAQNDVWEELVKRGALEDAVDKYDNVPAAYRDQASN